MPTLTPATQCPHCGYWIFTRLYYRTHVQECVNRTPAMKDLSDGALEVFPAVVPARYWWRVAGWLHSPENLCPMLRINRPEFAKDAQAAADIVQSDYSRNAGYTLVWTNPPQVELDTVLCEALGVDISAPKPLYTQISTPPTYIKDSPLMTIIEQSDTE